MKNIFKYIAGTLLASFVIASCHEDNGNYDYLSEDELKGQIIRIDTTGVGDNKYAFSSKYNPGDSINFPIKVHYPYQEDLKYSWIVYDYPYSSIPVGNTSIYPKPDTISHERDLKWEVNLKAGWHKCHFIVQDTVRGLSASMDMGGYFTVNAPGARSGVMILSEYNGQSDLEFYSSNLCLIYEEDVMVPHYYSQELGHGMLDGEPLFIGFQGDSWAGGYYYVFTTENAYRLNFDGLELMETFDQMFYQVPKYNPQAYINLNNSEFLINDGKLHIINNKKENDRKFSAPISGDYQAGKYLSIATISDWRPTAGAISAHQVIFDEKNLKFRPYFANDIKMSEFGPTVAGAFVDANKVPAKPAFMGGGVGGSTYAIVDNPEDGKRYLYMYNFYDVVDDGDLSADGANSVIDLSGCKDIMNIKYFQSNYNGSAFFYATDKALYSFSPTSGQTTANEIYTCAAGEEITCLSIFFHHASGGFPTPGVALWLGIWEEGKQEGKLLEWEIDPDAGVPVEFWGPMFGAARDEVPYVTTGFGKIKSIASVD